MWGGVESIFLVKGLQKSVTISFADILGSDLLKMSNCDNNNQQTTQSIADYLAQLLKDRKQLAAFPNVFNHIERLLDEGNNA